jgi:putative PIN family toxin of toxin-antitoxin system
VLRAVLDAGVLVAAAITPNGVCGRLLRAVAAGRVAMLACPLLIAELSDVLQRPKFRRYLSTDEARRFVEAVEAVAELRPDPTVPRGLTPDPDDDYLVALARTGGAAYLVSGDPHLTEMEHPTPPVITPARFLALLDNDRSATRSSSGVHELVAAAYVVQMVYLLL